MSLQLPREPEPYFYLLMRSDLDSLNPGKGHAQATHAAQAFAVYMDDWRAKMTYMTPNSEVKTFTSIEAASHGVVKTEEFARNILGHLRLYEQWKTSTPQGFGTTITLSVDGDLLKPVVEMARSAGFPAAVIHDPSYPLIDGKVIHSIPLDTCAYAFGDKPKLSALLGQFGLFA